MSTADRSQLRGRRAYWLLEIAAPWGVLRFADEAVTVTDADGDSYRYAGGLTRLTVGRGADLQALPIEVYADEVDWLLYLARGQGIEQASATLRRWHAGTSLEFAQVVLRGLLRDVELGDPRAPSRMRASLDANRHRMSDAVPPGEAQVNDVTWSGSPGPDEAIQGVHYPLVIGMPGFPSGSAAVPALGIRGNASGVTVYPVQFLIADGRIQASSVTISDLSATPRASEVHNVLTQEDDAGRLVSYVSISSGGSLIMEPGRAYFFGCSSDTGGGIRARDGDRPIRGLGEVLRYLYETYTRIDIDRDEMEARRAELDVFKIDTAIISPTKIDDWVQAEIVGKYPVVAVEGPRGLYFRRQRYTATPQDVSLHLRAGRTVGGGCRVERVSGLIRRPGEITNQLTVSYGPDAASGRMTRQAIISHRQNSNHTKWFPSYLAGVSHGIYGERPRELKLGVCWDAATAALVGRTTVERDALPRFGIQVSAPAELEAVRLGTVVSLDDPSLYATDRLATVEDVVVGPNTVTLDLTLLSDPMRTDVRTS